MDISVIVPFYNEEESLHELIEWIIRVMNENSYSYEILCVDDGSNDNSWKVIEDLSKSVSHLKAIRFRRNYGKAAALQCAFQSCSGEVVVTMDADLQDNPDELPALYRMIREDQYDVVSGWKKKRYDPLTKRWPSKFYNYTVRCASGIKLHDFNCGLKAYKQNVIKSIEIYGEMHRYIPVMVKKAGFNRIGEKVVQHQKRKYGTSKYGYRRFMTGFLDLLSIVFISRFGKKPMHFFGSLGTLMFITGFIAAGWVGGQKLYLSINDIPMIKVTDNPYFYLALAAMIIGTQLFLAGFLGELIARNATDRNVYLIADKINL